MTPMKLDPDAYYAIEGRHLALILQTMKRLYSESRFKNGDEMRDYAQALQTVVDHAEEFEL
jgi:hypothetical protein